DARSTYLDLAARLAMAVVIVGANRLGTINHCALTARVAAAAGLRVEGFILSQTTPTTDESCATNAAVIASQPGLRCLGELPDAAPEGGVLRDERRRPGVADGARRPG